jgi:hypothetical protein
MTFVEGFRWHTWHGRKTGGGIDSVVVVVVRGDMRSSSNPDMDEKEGSWWLLKDGIVRVGKDDLFELGLSGLDCA